VVDQKQKVVYDLSNDSKSIESFESEEGNDSASEGHEESLNEDKNKSKTQEFAMDTTLKEGQAEFSEKKVANKR
jgi:hypothetical protein